MTNPSAIFQPNIVEKTQTLSSIEPPVRKKTLNTARNLSLVSRARSGAPNFTNRSARAASAPDIPPLDFAASNLECLAVGGGWAAKEPFVDRYDWRSANICLRIASSISLIVLYRGLSHSL